MKALRKLQGGPGHMEIVEIPPPLPGPGEVIVEIKKAGICGTDIHVQHGLYSRVRPPVTVGHEFSGVVVELGAGVTDWKIGDRVTVDTAAGFCGTCAYCRTGETQLCNDRLGYGSSRDGGFTSFVAVREGVLHGLPAHISFEEGALGEPLACATHAVMEISSAKPGQTVLIIGPGPIGLLVLQIVKALGARAIISGVKKDESRLQLARQLGADHSIMVDEKDVSNFLNEITGGYGADIVFECSGSAAGINDGFAAVRKGGEVNQVGINGHPVTLNYDAIIMKEIILKGSFAHNRGAWEKAIRLLQENKIKLGPLISGEFSLSQWEEGFQSFAEGRGLKYLLKPIP